MMKKVIESLIQTQKARYKYYDTFDDAILESSGYNSQEIVAKAKISLIKVLNGDAAFTRDSVILNKIEYSWPLLAGLMWIAAQKKNVLKVIDFGGSLGECVYQYNKFFQALDYVEWKVVEQELFVICGKQYFELGNVKFYEDISTSQKNTKSDILLLSGVLQYLKNPYVFIDEVMNYAFEFILIDRTSFSPEGKECVVVQQVQPEIYDASYPCWLFSYDNFLKSFIQNYILIEEFDSFDKMVIPSFFKGFIFKRNK